MPKEQILELCENIDRLISTDLHGRRFIIQIYEASRHQQGGPLCYLVAEKLLKVVRPGDVIIFGTGFLSFPRLVGEQDGPVGSACLARALNRCLDARPVIITDNDQLNMVAQTCRGAGFHVFNDLERALKLPQQLGLIDFPKDTEEAKDKARKLLDELNPSVLIAIERPQ